MNQNKVCQQADGNSETPNKGNYGKKECGMCCETSNVSQVIYKNVDSQVCFVTLVLIPVDNLQEKEDKNILKS